MLEHFAVHHREGEDLGDPFGLDERQQAASVEASFDEDRGPDHDRGGAVGVELRGVKHRHHCDEPVVLTELGLERHGHRFEVDRSVVSHHPFRERGGATGVEVRQRGAVGDDMLRFGIRRTAGQVREGGHGGILWGAVAVDQKDVNEAEWGGESVLDSRPEFGLDDDRCGRRMVEDIRDFACAPTEIDRHAHQPQLRAGVVGDEELRAIAGRERERVAAAEAVAVQAVGDAVDPAVELAVGESTVPVDQGQCLGSAPGRPGKAVTDVDPVDQVATDFGGGHRVPQFGGGAFSRTGAVAGCVGLRS